MVQGRRLVRELTHFPKRRPELPSVALWHSTRVPGCTIHSATQTGAGKEKSGWGTRVSWEGGGGGGGGGSTYKATLRFPYDS